MGWSLTAVRDGSRTILVGGSLPNRHRAASGPLSIMREEDLSGRPGPKLISQDDAAGGASADGPASSECHATDPFMRKPTGSTSVPTAAHAILGLLELDDGSSHGYDLARHFGDDQPLAQVIHLEPAMLYHHLKRLARAGWATANIEPQGTRPARQVYQITAAGRAELRRWLAEPVAHTREIRLEFLVKLYLAQRLDPDLASLLLAGQLDTCRRLEASLVAQLAALADSDAGTPDLVFSRRVLELRLAQTQAAVRWLAHTGG